MTDEDYRYHRSRAITIDSLGYCSRMKNGLVKIEGRAPMTEDELRQVRYLAPHLEQLLALV